MALYLKLLLPTEYIDLELSQTIDDGNRTDRLPFFFTKAMAIDGSRKKSIDGHEYRYILDSTAVYKAYR